MRLHDVESGDNIAAILAAQGLATPVAAEVIAAAREVHDLGRIKVGDQVHLRLDPTGTRLVEMRYPLDPERTLVVSGTEGAFAARVEVAPFEDRMVGLTGVVEDNLWDAAIGAGLPPDEVSRLAGVFDWQIDFNTEIQPGDRFRLLVQRRATEDGRERMVGMHAAEFVNAGRVFRAVRFRDAEGEPAWYDPSGDRMATPYLKSPLPYHRVGSGFNLRRFHPILKYRRPHWGQDYGAPTGTPVRAVASGRVEFVGTRGGYGRHVRVVHDGRYASSYSHLSRYGRGVRAGVRVEQGRVIGYVGSTGLSTSPHLHFEFYDRGRPVDYAKQKFPKGQAIDPALRSEFQAARLELLPRLLALPEAEVGAGPAGGGVPPLASAAGSAAFPRFDR